MSILDLGCGNGRLLDYLKKFKPTSYIGVDQSSELLKQARNQYDEEFIEDDISSLLKLEGKFDAIFAIASFHHLPPANQLSALKLWKNHLKKDGLLLMTNWNLDQVKYRSQLRRSFFLPFFGFRGVLIPWKDKLKRYYYAFTKKRLERLLKRAGYTILEQEYVKSGEISTQALGNNILTVARNESN